MMSLDPSRPPKPVPQRPDAPTASTERALPIESHADAVAATDHPDDAPATEAEIDEALEMTFPASDPVALWRGHGQ